MGSYVNHFFAYGCAACLKKNTNFYRHLGKEGRTAICKKWLFVVCKDHLCSAIKMLAKNMCYLSSKHMDLDYIYKIHIMHIQ